MYTNTLNKITKTDTIIREWHRK